MAEKTGCEHNRLSRENGSLFWDCMDCGALIDLEEQW